MSLKKFIVEGVQRILEDINVPVNVGDEILTGKFKNKKTKVKSIGKNEKGDVTINDKPALKFRIPEKRIQELNKIEPKKGLTTVYRCIDGEYDTNYSGVEFFSVNKEYSSTGFGDNCYEFIINTNGAKILNLEKWNRLYTEKTGKNGNLFNRHQGLFIIGSMVIESGYKKELDIFSQALGDEMSQKFINDFNNCDAIYGEDAGYPGEFVFAVKNKSIIKRV